LKIRAKDNVVAITRKRNHDRRAPPFQKDDLVFLLQEDNLLKLELK
jgi:hypothetical protein